MIELHWFVNHWLQSIILILLILGRIIWIIIGLWFFLEKTNCKDNVTNYFIVYFSQAIYIFYTSLLIYCNGCIADHVIGEIFETD